jgi:hypothetical protein
MIDGAEFMSEGKGEVCLTIKVPKGKTDSVRVSNVFYIQGAFDLLLQRQLFTKGIRPEFVPRFRRL